MSAFQLITPLRPRCLEPPTRGHVCVRKSLTMAHKSLSVKKRRTACVNPNNGLIAKPNSESVNVSVTFIELPPTYLQSIDIRTDRKAEAVVYAPGDVLDDVTEVPAIVFMHGFSQRPRNYESTLRMIAAQGYMVLAPRVWLMDIASHSLP
eukprot:IDg15107t1